MYGKSPARVLPLLLGLHLTGKNWWASKSFHLYYPLYVKIEFVARRSLKGCWELETKLQFILVQTSRKLQFGGLLWGSALDKQV